MYREQGLEFLAVVNDIVLGGRLARPGVSMYQDRRVWIAAFFGLALSCRRAAPEPPAASIGTATMRAGGTIVLQLTARQGGMSGHATIEYPPQHPEYGRVLKHLKGLRPGETKSVPPWPD